MTIPEIVARPAETVQELYKKAGCPVLDGDWGVIEHFQQAVSNLASGELPCLNDLPVERIRHQSLVRYYGMVQDMLNPEFYIGAFQRPNGQWITTKYCDPDISEDCADSEPIVWERRPIVLVPIPGLSRWALQKPGADNPSSRAAAPTSLQSPQLAPASPTGAQVPSGHANTGHTAGNSPAPGQDTPSSQRSQGQGPQQQQARPKRERSSSDANASCVQLQAHGSEQSPSTFAAATVAVPAAASLSVEGLHQEDGESPRDTDQAGDQGDGALASGYALGGAFVGPGDGDEGAARPRTRRREDADHGGITGPVVTPAAISNPDRDFGSAAAGCCEGSAHAPHPEQKLAPAADHVPNSCMAYLYGSAPTPLLHEIVEVIGILSYVPEFAQLEYGSADDPHLAHELASLVLEGSGGATAAATNNLSNDTPSNPPQQQHGEIKQAREGGAAMDAGAHNLGALAADRLAFEALRAAHPPTSKVARLHTILVRRTPPLVPTPSAIEASSASSLPPHSCTIGSAATTTATTVTATSSYAPTTAPPTITMPGAVLPTAASVPPLRERALGLLRFALGGDALVAEYVLMTLLARVANRADPAALGMTPLNISGCPNGATTTAHCSSSSDQSHPAAGVPSTSFSVSGHSNPLLAADRLGRGPSDFAAGLQAAISSLVPLSGALPLSLAACGGVSWSPARDVVRERTAASPLQLAPGTVLVLDETSVSPGQFSSQGFASFKALKTLVEQQVLMYDFESSQHPIPVDLPVILLSEGRSLLGSSAPLKIPLNATQTLPSVDAVLAAASDLGAVRSYLAAARVQEGYDLGEGMPSVLEQFFVDARRSVAEGDNAAGGGGRSGGVMSAEDFHLKLSLARLLVLSHGEKQLTRERWQQLLRMEHMREERLRVVR